MLKVVVGDLLRSRAQTLVNTVNCVGVMGKGIALEFKRAYPEMYADYVERCNARLVRIGYPYAYFLADGRSIINFPTKLHWRSPSKLSDIVLGLKYLQKHYREWGITSMAVPPLGCGNGQLEWRVVGPTLYSMLANLGIDIEFYAPVGTPPEQLSLEFLAHPKPANESRNPEPRMEPAWVALVAILDRINQMPVHQPIGRIAFQKIAYFATEFGIPTGFQFQRGTYGPYDRSVKRVIARLLNNGLVEETPLGQMLQVTVGRTFADAARSYKRELSQWAEAIDFVSDFVSRMNTIRIEAAATVHFVANELRSSIGDVPTESMIVDEVIRWKGERLKNVNVSVLTRSLGTLRVINAKGDEKLQLPSDDLMLA